MAWTSGVGLADAMAVASPRRTKFRRMEARCTGLVYGILLLSTASSSPPSTSLGDEMWGCDAGEFTGRDYRSLLPEPGKMPLVAGDQVVGAGGIGAFQEFVVVGI